jgi:hypothetical protein
MFRALLAQLQEALHQRYLVYVLRACYAPGLEFHSNPGAAK